MPTVTTSCASPCRPSSSNARPFRPRQLLTVRLHLIAHVLCRACLLDPLTSEPQLKSVLLWLQALLRALLSRPFADPSVELSAFLTRGGLESMGSYLDGLYRVSWLWRAC